MDIPPAHAPGPSRRWLGLVDVRALAKNCLGATQQLQHAHCDVVRMHIGSEHAVDMFSPEWVREALMERANDLVRRERGAARPAQSHGQGLRVTEGAPWKAQRRSSQPGSAPKRVASHVPLMAAACADALDSLRDTDLPRLDVAACLTRLTMGVILRTLFNATASEGSAEVAAAIKALGEFAIADSRRPVVLPDWLPGRSHPRRRWALHTVDTLIWRHIHARQQLGPKDRAAHSDLLATLMTVTGRGKPMRARALRNQCRTLFQAGHETSATALTWWLWTLATHPHVAQRARAEVDAVLQGRRPEAADLARLPCLEHTIQETLRLYPPAPALMTRRTTAAIRLGPWRFPKAWLVRLTPWVMHHDATLFPDPEASQPARVAHEAKQPIPRVAHLPFGTGPRVCIGQHFAMSEMLVIAAMLLQRFEWQPLAGAAIPEPELTVTLRPREALRLDVRRRNAQSTLTDDGVSGGPAAAPGLQAAPPAGAVCHRDHAKGGAPRERKPRSGRALGALASLKGS